MKKTFFKLAVAGALAASLAACSSPSSNTPAAGSASSGETAASAPAGSAASGGEGLTVEVWTNDRHDLDYVEAQIAEYNESNGDGIKINLTVITEDYENMIQMAYTGGTAPDIVGANNLPLNAFADTGILIPLNDYIDASEEYKKVNEPYDHAFEGKNLRNGNIYSVFSGLRSGVRVQYNIDVLAENGYTEIPKDLPSYIDMAKAITEKGAGEYYGIGFTSSSPFERLLEMVAQVSGVHYYDYVKGKYDFSGYKDILVQGRRFIDEGIAYPDQQGVDNMRALFAEGDFTLWSNASQEAGVFTKQIPVTGFEWGVAEVPSLTGEIRGALTMTPSKSYGIISSSENKDAVWKVIEFFQSEAFLKGYLENGFSLPMSDYMRGAIDASKIGRLADFATLAYEDVYPEPPVINLTGENYRAVLWNAVMGYVDIDEAIEDLNTRYNEALEADIASGSTKRLVIPDFDPLNPSERTPQYLDK